MIVMNEEESPFLPELGIIPPVIIERPVFQDYAKIFKEKKPKNIILIGERGSGKTVTLKIFRDFALTQGRYPIMISCDEEKADIDKLANTIYRKTYESLTEQILSFRAAEYLKKMFKITIKYEKMGSTAVVELGKPAKNVDQHNLAKEIGKIIKERKIVFLFDETQTIFSRGVARYLINFFYSELPDVVHSFITVLGGTYRLERDILEATPAYRAFPVYTLLPFTKDETKKLLQETTKTASINFSDNTCHSVWKDTQGLPYYVHYCGDWLYRKKGEPGVIDQKFYEKHKQEMFKHLCEEKLERRLQTLEEKGEGYREVYEVIAKVTAPLRDTELPTPRLRDVPNLSQITGTTKFENINPGSIGVYVNRLWREGYIKQVSRGRYVPSDILLAKHAKKTYEQKKKRKN